MTSLYLGVPTTEGKAVLGPSSPLIPALQTPDPLSITMGVFSSSDISKSIIKVNVKCPYL